MTAEKPSELSYNPHMPLSQALLLPRIVIENTMPTLDGGQFAVKPIAGREVVVTSKVFADGHDKLAVRIRWREEGDEDWQSEVMTDQGNNGWQASFRPEQQGRYVLHRSVDRSLRQFSYELEKKHNAAVPVSAGTAGRPDHGSAGSRTQRGPAERTTGGVAP
jgi:starch synthase (maltosyl-transferring)